MSSKGSILVTPRSLSHHGHILLDRLTSAGYEVKTPFPGKQPTVDDLAGTLPDCIGYLAGVERIPGTLLERCPSLKVISRNGVGYENIDMETAHRLGIAVKVTRGANARGVAELAIGLMFSLARGIPAVHASIKQGGWDRSIGFELAGKTLGVIGTGQIGQQVAQMASTLGMQVVGQDLYPSRELEQALPGFRYRDLEAVCSQSDIVTLHCPAGDTPLMDQRLISILKPGCFIINTARASLVDQNVMVEALNRGLVAGYAVDAFDQEPPELTPLLLHPKTLVTAHIGGFTQESVSRATERAIENIIAVLEQGAGTDV